MRKLWTILIVVILNCGSPEVVLGAKKCDRNVMDTCTNELLMLGDEKFIFPTKIAQMNKRCKDLKRLETCTKDWSKSCLRGDTKNSISVLLYSISRTNKGYCTNAARKNVFMSFGDCLNAHKKKLSALMTQMNRDFHGIKEYQDPKMRIPLACCNYYKFKQASIAYLTGKCSENEITETEILIDSYAHDILNLLCGDYVEESDKCSKIIAKTPKWTKSLNSKAFLLPLADILDSI